MKVLVGSTGFVGGNLAEQINFDLLCHSKNVHEAYDSEPDLLVYAGVLAEKFVANKHPEADFQHILDAIENIKRIRPKFLVLLSTSDVFKKPNNVDEDSKVDLENLEPYGKNRFYLEEWVRANIPNHLVIRLAGLYGNNIKKNFLYDYIHFLPQALKEDKMQELSKSYPDLGQYYKLDNTGFYRLQKIDEQTRNMLKEIFKTAEFSALNFTHSEGIYQYYNLKNMAQDITIAMDNNLKLLHLVAAPVKTNDLYQYLTGEIFQNIISPNPPHYDLKTKHYQLFNGENGYVINQKNELEDIKTYLENYKI